MEKVATFAELRMYDTDGVKGGGESVYVICEILRSINRGSTMGEPAEPRRRVALIIETSNEYARGILHGIREYVREHEPWAFSLGEHRRGEPPDWLARWQGDGIIARIENDQIANAIARSKLPTVDVSAARRIPQLPWVETDNEAIARVAFDHLLERGYEHFAFVGAPPFQWSVEREEWFKRLARKSGHECHIMPKTNDVHDAPSGRERLNRLAKWISKLPKPIGLLAAYDIMAHEVIDACRSVNIAIPEEVAIVGVDNDELLCDLCDPPLTSIALDTDQTGYRAAELLDQMMCGNVVPGEPHLFKPIGIVPRQSTDSLAMSDPEVVKAVQYIRLHACEGISVTDLLEQVSTSRRVFEQRFREQVGKTAHQLIVQTRLDRVKEMLINTDLPLADIAHRCGFSHQEYMSVVFKKIMGLPPSEYRVRHQSG